MRVMLDINVLMDVFEQRELHYEDSAKVLSLAIGGEIEAFVPGHSPATIVYLASKSIGRESAEIALDWLLASFPLQPADKDVYLRARAMGYADYEDAVVVAMAEVASCDFVVTRNSEDFRKSSVTPLNPAELLDLIVQDDSV